MSIDKSLRRKNSLQRARNVLNRGERIKAMMDLERWEDGRSPFGLPKTKVVKVVIKKTKKAKDEEAAEGAEGAEGAAAATAAPAAEQKGKK
jgi:small basic protein (TIGR04137 family)